MKTVLVTGGAGFIGSNFIRHIYRKYPDYRIMVLDSLTYAGNIENIPQEIRDADRFEFWYGDINNLDLVNDLVAKSQVIVHFAAETHVARSLYLNRVFFTTDVLGTQSVANAVLKHADTVDRFIHISTSEVYGSARVEPMDEDHPLFMNICFCHAPQDKVFHGVRPVFYRLAVYRPVYPLQQVVFHRHCYAFYRHSYHIH